MRAGGALERLAIPDVPLRDNYELPTSPFTFPDGANFRTEELPTTVEEYEETFALAEKWHCVVNRVTDTRGIMFDSDKEIEKKCKLGREYGCEVLMAPGPGEHRYDTSQQAEAGALVEGKTRGMDATVAIIESMLRAVELGCRGFVTYDEGVLYLALKLREQGELPAEVKFKLSANLSIANAAAVRFWYQFLGPQDEINPARDLSLPMLAAMRQVMSSPLDVHIFAGTRIARTMEAPEIVRVASPVYLKNARLGQGITTEARFQQCVRVVETIRRWYPKARQSERGLLTA